MSSEPAYISDNGKRVPYIPKEITTHREAYAATLHVLFKHVADFHICIVKAFSNKYGIPEDDIMQTIQESDEFKNMAVDPVLNHSDSLGYLTPVELAAEPAKAEPEPAKAEPEPAKAEPAVMKKIVKKKQPMVVPVVPVVVPVVHVESNASASNAKIIRKKIAPTKQPQATQEPQEPQEPQFTDSERTDSERTDSVSYSSQMDATVIKKKIIRKKIAPEAQEQDPQPQDPQSQVQIAPADATVIKKIIRKKK
jgi:hypothetical protein